MLTQKQKAQKAVFMSKEGEDVRLRIDYVVNRYGGKFSVGCHDEDTGDEFEFNSESLLNATYYAAVKL